MITTRNRTSLALWGLLALLLAGTANHSEAGAPDGKIRYGRISGYKFFDSNQNGEDNAEPRLEGWTITLRNLGPIYVRRTAVTDENGEFSFRRLPLQRYEVCEQIPEVTPPWVPTTPTCVTLRLTEERRFKFTFFGNYREEDHNNGGCTLTQGYWKNHESEVAALVPGTLLLGSTGYSSSQLLSILTTPTGGNALIILAHQLIAAKLNVLNGASNTPIATTIQQADQAIGSLVVPPVGSDDVSPSSPLGQTMTSLSTILDSYNNGNLGVPHCED